MHSRAVLATLLVVVDLLAVTGAVLAIIQRRQRSYDYGK